VHQYSVDVQRELPGNMAVTIGYTGATGRDLGFGGSNTTAVNINQIDPAVARAVFPGPGGTWDAAALNRSVPNPFFGIAAAGELGRRATVPAGQLLRPFPQFGDINLFEVTAARRQYHAMILELEKRVSASGWGGRLSYTFSSTRDNQFGESNSYGINTAIPQNNYDLDAEYGPSNNDSPHRIILAPIVKLPGSTEGVRGLVVGGWSLSAIVELVSGAPLNAVISPGTSNNNLGLLGGRLRPNLVGDPNFDQLSDAERVSTSPNPNARWFDRSAFQTPAAGQYGNAPRTLDDVRLQFRKNLDLVVAKDVRFVGGQTAQVRFEILNLTNTPKFGGATNTTDTATFGRVGTQRGFMRIWQLSFRYAF
jgi:hypothetical protein